MARANLEICPLLDLDSIRKQFPSLERTVNNHPAVFFDGPGGTQIPGRSWMP